MNASNVRRRLPLILCLLAAGTGLALLGSCSSAKKQQQQTTGDYASSSPDGHYNPYPNVPGGTPHYQEYTEAPPPPPEPEPAPKPKAKSSSSTSSKTASTSSKSSSSKKKPSTSTASTSSKSKSKSKTKSSGSGTVHIVKRGDSLYSLAKKYHTTVSKIKSANGLSSDLIRDGQKLKIP